MTEQWEYVVVGQGALGSGAAYHLARGGHQVLALERFELGHVNGGSHDTTRILRHSYHTPGYAALTIEAYDDWATLEADSGEQLVTVVGGLDMFPVDAAIPITQYTGSMDAIGIPYEELSADEVTARWPTLVPPAGTRCLHQARGAIVPAARGVATMQDQARRHGAVIRDHSPVSAVRDLGADGVEVDAGGTTYRCRRLVVCADAWTNDVLAGLGRTFPLTVTCEQVTYFRPPRPERFAQDRMPLWLWMDDPTFYGFPTYGESTIKCAQDAGGPAVSPDDRPYDTDQAMLDLLTDHLSRVVPEAGPAERSVRCLYTMTPDRDFILSPVPGHEAVLVGMGCGHGFKFAPTIGRLLATLAVEGETKTDISAYRMDRPALTDPDYVQHWLL